MGDVGINPRDHLSDSVPEIRHTSSSNVPLDPFISRGRVSGAQRAFPGF